MSTLHGDAKPAINFFGALFSAGLGGFWAMGPILRGGGTAEDLPYVAGGLALTSAAGMISWRWGDDSIGTLPALAIPAIMLAPQSSPIVLGAGPHALALAIPASMLLVMSIPFVWDQILSRVPTQSLADASPRSWVRRVLAEWEIDLVCAEAVAQRKDASEIADRLEAKLQRAHASYATRAAAYLGCIEPERLTLLMASSEFERVRTYIAKGAAIAGVHDAAPTVTRLAREHASTPEGLSFASAAARFGDLEPIRAFLADFDEDPAVFHALVDAGPAAAPLLEELRSGVDATESRIRKVDSIARRIGA